MPQLHQPTFERLILGQVCQANTPFCRSFITVHTVGHPFPPLPLLDLSFRKFGQSNKLTRFPLHTSRPRAVIAEAAIELWITRSMTLDFGIIDAYRGQSDHPRQQE